MRDELEACQIHATQFFVLDLLGVESEVLLVFFQVASLGYSIEGALARALENVTATQFEFFVALFLVLFFGAETD